ncbi:hypothetical protein K490DRAFT_10407, partial [Saccharata proteae CBS 121410]
TPGTPAVRSASQAPGALNAVQTDPSAPPPLPHPSTFDILQPLHSTLERLLLPPKPPAASTKQPEKNDSTEPLEIQSLPGQVTKVQLKIQRARQAVKVLGDIDRTVDEQDEEIAELEERVKALRETLAGLG